MEKNNYSKFQTTIRLIMVLIVMITTTNLNAQIVCTDQPVLPEHTLATTSAGYNNDNAAFNVSASGSSYTITMEAANADFGPAAYSNTAYDLPLYFEFVAQAPNTWLDGNYGLIPASATQNLTGNNPIPAVGYYWKIGRGQGSRAYANNVLTYDNLGGGSQAGVKFAIKIDASGNITYYENDVEVGSATGAPTGVQYHFVFAGRPGAIGTQRTATVDQVRFYEYAEVCEALIVDLDGDGIDDKDDEDDDNDGVPDTTEQAACSATGLANSANVVFLEEDFGTGTTKVDMSSIQYASTTYTYDSGPNQVGTTTTGQFLVDGEYAIVHLIHNNNGTVFTGSNWGDPHDDLAIWAESIWTADGDHTPGDTDGRMLVFNADATAGTFYTTSITGVENSVDLIVSYWARNIDTDDTGRINPDITINVTTAEDTGTNIYTANSGTLDGELQGGGWTQFTYTIPNASLTSASNAYYLNFVNNAPGGAGNDLALDDFSAEQNLCDTDGDGIPNTRDLDDDGDGIPSIVELGIGGVDSNQSGTLFNSGLAWVDGDMDGHHDTYEASLTPPDFDGDGVPNYLDFDSDNDAVFDVFEYDGLGDIDINGDGKGDYVDSDGDGIKDIYDTYVGFGTYDGSTVNGYPDPIDTDGGSSPNYIDVTSGFFAGDDIDGTIFSHLDGDNDGDIDISGTDLDEDGMDDNFDTDDTFYGSPRDLDGSYTIHFDGRNDYISEPGFLGGLPGVTMMAWIKMDALPGTFYSVMGEDNGCAMNIASNGRVQLRYNGATTTFNTSPLLSVGVWAHVAITVDPGSTASVFINGKEHVMNAGSVAGAIATSGDDFTIGKLSDADSQYFDGQLDEIKVFNRVLTQREIRVMVNQELDETDFQKGAVTGATFDLDEAYTAANLLRYYKMDSFTDDNLELQTESGVAASNATIYNVHLLQDQTAPMPYETVGASGAVVNTAAATWLRGTTWSVNGLTQTAANANDGILLDNATREAYYNYPIITVKSGDNLTVTSVQSVSGLIVEAGGILTLAAGAGDAANGSALFVTDYLKVDGVIDLQDESQLIQTAESYLDPASAGYIMIDQQGVGDSHIYNYWSSPTVATIGAAYSVGDVLKRSTSTSASGGLVDESFCAAFDCADNGTQNTSTYWLFKFDPAAYEYGNWIQIRNNAVLNPGQGFTMKGSTATGATTNTYERTFVGLPNNAPTGSDIVPATFTSATGHAVLVGNPFPSALDAHDFIDDNVGVISGPLRFWEHWSTDTHILSVYQGGYATLTKLASSPANAHGGLISSTGSSVSVPGRYIPVGQGFFVDGASTSSVVFRNSQRAFVDESSTAITNSTGSNFLREENNGVSSDENSSDKELIWIQIQSPDGIVRTLVTGFAEECSDDFDYGYDAEMHSGDNFKNDSYFILDDRKLVIQGFGEFDSSKEIKLGIQLNDVKSGGTEVISLADLENFDSSRAIYLKDKLEGVYHDLRLGNYEFVLEEGVHNDRFSIVFSREESKEGTLSSEETALSQKLIVYPSNSGSSIVVEKSVETQIDTIAVYSSVGQLIGSWSSGLDDSRIELPVNVSTGAYIVNVTSNEGTVSQKVFVE